MRELVSEGLVSDYFFERGFLHDPNAIDNPKLLHAEYRYMLQRSANTGPLISSVILYVNELELKESLNESFRERHPNLPPSLTLSKIRNLKKSCLLGCLSLSLEVSTCALAVIYFERLVMQALVTKVNRHLSMAVSLLLAYKVPKPRARAPAVPPPTHHPPTSLLPLFSLPRSRPNKRPPPPPRSSTNP